ncbi:TonB-dependent receptor plug domain-containing protein [Winogradskyella sp. A3E31]|uniref:TonB-dependent receptor plug domain-containing protein n=1 Tax=Winogradskyella sp. A3E31 TaxID=3349637 RepID=UPI00398B4E63
MTSILKIVEEQFDVRFSYGDSTVANITITPPSKDFSLKQTLNYLSQHTNLIFNDLSGRFISIEPNDPKPSKPEYNLQTLDEVVIQNFLSKGISKNINGDIEIVPQDFEILPGLIEPDILQTIQSLPGIVSSDELISNITMRGGTNDQNLILYEGMRMYQTGHFFGLISAFNPYLTETVNVTKNGTRAKYGSGVSGLIHIENSSERASQFTAGAGLNLLSADGFAKIPVTTKSELQVSARRSFTDALVSPTYDAYFERIFSDSELNSTRKLSENDNFYFYDFSTKYIYDINPNTKLKANFISIHNSLNYDQTTIDSNNETESTRSELDQTSFAGGLSFSTRFNKSTEGSAQIYFSNYELNGFNNVVEAGQLLIQRNRVEDLGIRFDVLKALDKNLNLNTGYQLNEVGVTNLEDVNEPRFRSLIKEVLRTHAIYSEAEFTSNSKNTYLRIGLRGNYIEKFEDIFFEPRLSINQKFLNHFRAEFLAETKHQSITQIIDLQQDFFGIEKRRWQLSNTNDADEVPVVQGSQVSFGLNYNNKGWLIGAEGYIKTVDGINSRSQGFQNQFQFETDTGFYKIKGVEMLLQKRAGDFSTWLSYTYSKNDYEFENFNQGQSFANNLDITHVVNTSLSYNLKNFRVAAGLNWHSGRPYTTPLQNQDPDTRGIEYASPNNQRLEDYLRLDVSASHQFDLSDNSKIEIGLSIWNLTNTTNIINRYYTLNDNDEVIENVNTALKLTPNFSCRIHFN